jgi:D-alanine-D-alanine ligase
VIALIYNLKADEPGNSSSTILPSPPHHQEGHAGGPSPAPARIRANDLYAEWDTAETVNAVRAAIEERFPVLMVEANEDAFEVLRARRPGIVFNIAEGLHGPSREAQVPAMLEMLRIPYLGSDPLTLALCLDKARAKEILSYHGIPTAPFSVVSSMEELDDLRVKFPAMVKPLHEGSSKGIYDSCVARGVVDLVREVRTVLEVYSEPALVEEFLPGREFTVAVLGNGARARVLPIVEIRFDALPPGVNPIYSYEAKWIWDQSERPLQIFDCPAKLDEPLRATIESICLSAYRHLRCRDWSRIDVRLDGRGVPHILEINPLPGILPKPEDNSCFPKAARASGLSYQQLINEVLDIAMVRCGVPASGGHNGRSGDRPMRIQESAN